MSSLFFNKIAGAILASTLGVILIGKFADSTMRADIPDQSEFSYSVLSADTGPVKEQLVIPFPSAEWIAARDAEAGKKVFKKCASCHNADPDGPNSTGPHLYDVVERPKASVADFNYSAAIKNKGGTWTYEDMDTFLTKPSAFIPKTNMAFVGLKKEKDRAAVIEYLRLQSAAPKAPLTEAAPIPGADAVDTDAETLADDATGTDAKGAQELTDEAVPTDEHKDDAPKDGGH